MAALASLATAAALLVVPSQTAHAAPPHAAPPPNPTNTQLNAAAQLKASLANEVGNLSAQAASLNTQLTQLQGLSELAEQKYAFAAQKLQEAQTAAQAAQASATKANAVVANAQKQFVAYAQASYMSGDVAGTTGSLLSAGDPNVLLQQSALDQYQSSHQISAIGTLQRATVTKSNADAAARKALEAQAAATKAAAEARQAAADQLAATQAQAKVVQQTLQANQVRLDAARTRLLTLTGQRAKYNAYVRYQAYLAEQRRKAEIKRQQAAARQAALERAKELERERQHSSNNGGGGGGGGGGSSSDNPAPTGGAWTAARGREAANRALRWLGTIYIWAGGNNWGPTDGGCTDSVSPCGTKGFDCSGLAMFAWGPYLSMDHYAATQYSQAGSYHPSPGNFKPGDLLFWSNGSSQSSIHHVAIYIGGGDVVEAPDSGMDIRIRPWTSIPSIFYGATRPLT